MKIIKTNGIYHLTKLKKSDGWYWDTDYASGDLYEAEELFRHNHPIKSNRLVFVHYPDGRVVEPIKAKVGQYFGAPIFAEGCLYILMVDFPENKILILQYDDTAKEITLRAEISLAEVKDCYNLMLKESPLMLVRQGSEDIFQIVWPEKAEFAIGNTEAFDSRDGDKLYFSRWLEDTEYLDEIVIRQFPSGKILEIIEGVLWEMPDGQRWILQ